VRVEELVVEVDNGRNVVVVQAVVPRGAHVGKWLNRLRVAWECSCLNPPCCGRQRAGGGGLGWPSGCDEMRGFFLADGAASGHRRWAWRR
jgi:hypothetical protein